MLTRRQRMRRERGPGVRLQWQLALLPRATAHLHRRLVERKLVHPGRKAAVAPKTVQLVQHRDERIVSRLLREIVVIAAAQVAKHVTSPRHLEPGSAQEQLMQPSDRLVPSGAAAPKILQPAARLLV